MIIYALVEGLTDEAMAHRLALTSGHQVGTCYGKKGSSWIKKNVGAFNKLATSVPVLTLLDFMDADLPCPPEILDKWLPHRHSRMLFRVVVRELESWLLADREGMAGFLGVPLGKIPLAPENLGDPKQTLVNLARQSRYSSIRSALVPQQGSTAQVGRSYVSEIIQFTSETWNPERARESSPSLNSCLHRLAEIK
ncbi:protein of unknown function [Desulfonatronum zhilinae]|nr:protein of unknown function [Desulfonatronum zhilinae]